MKTTKIKNGLLLVSVACGALAVGCELIVDFDRTRIPADLPDASLPDANVPETSTPFDGGDAGTADADAAPSDAGDGGDADTESDADAG